MYQIRPVTYYVSQSNPENDTLTETTGDLASPIYCDYMEKHYYGPDIIDISQGVPGTYRLSVFRHWAWAVDPPDDGLSTSGMVITIWSSKGQIITLTPPPGEYNVWHVCKFKLTTEGVLFDFIVGDTWENVPFVENVIYI